MKICLFTVSLKRQMTGIDKVAVEFANEMVVRGHEIVYITHPGNFSSDNLALTRKAKLYYIQSNYQNSNISRLRSILQSERPDVVLPMVGNSIVSIFLAALRGLSIPLIISEHSNPEYYVKLWWTLGLGISDRHRSRQMCFHGADHIHLLNQSFVDDFPEFIAEKCSVIKNPSHVSEHQKYFKNFDEREKVVVSVGRLDEHSKKFSLLINAFSIVSKAAPDWQLKIYGEGHSAKNYEEQIKKLNLKDCVKLEGFTNEPVAVIANSRVFCLPSLFEGCPLTLIEAKEMGVPAVGFSDCSGVNEMVNHGVDGMLVEHRSAESLAKTLLAVIMDAAYLEKLSVGAKTSVDVYDSKQIYDAWENLLKKIIEKAAVSGTKLDSVPNYSFSEELDFELDLLTKGDFNYWKKFPAKSYQQEWWAAKNTLALMEGSKSWKLTYPLRLMNLILKCLINPVETLHKLTSRKAVLRAKTIRILGWLFRSNEILFLDVPGFNDMRRTFGDLFHETCFLEDVPYDFLGELRISRAALIVSACGGVKRDFATKPKRIELWHASGAIKKVNNWSYSKLGCEYVVVAPSQDMVREYAKYFHVPLERVKPLGLPKTDIYSNVEFKEETIAHFYEKKTYLKGKKIYLFLPTFRGYWPDNVSYNITLNFLKVAALLSDDEVVLVKLHPSLSVCEGNHNIDFVDNKVIDCSEGDIEELLIVSDVVVSDYSSIIYDAIILNKPMLMYSEDIDAYDMERGLSYDYRNVMPCPILEEPDEKMFVELLRRGEIDRLSYDHFRKTYVGCCDGDARKRVLEEFSAMLGYDYEKSKSFIGSSSI